MASEFHEGPYYGPGEYPDIQNIGAPVDEKYESELKDVVSAYLPWRPDEFPGMQPVSFTRNSIVDLEENDYFVCEKSDGVRYLLLIMKTPKGAASFLIDRKNNYHHVDIPFPLPDSLKSPGGFEFHSETLLDGEMVISNDGSRKSLRYLVFDAIAINGKSVVHDNFSKRLGFFSRDVLEPYKKFMREHIELQQKIPFIVGIKKQQRSYGVNIVFQEIKNLNSKNDGLILTPVNTPYSSGTCYKLYKWKPQELNSVDFKISVVKNKDGKPHFKLMAFDKIKYREYDDLTPDRDLYESWRNNPPDGKIGEFSWDPSITTTVWKPGYASAQREGGWVFLKYREDKDKANDINVVDAVIESIRDGVSQQDIIAVTNTIRDKWKRREEHARYLKDHPEVAKQERLERERKVAEAKSKAHAEEMEQKEAQARARRDAEAKRYDDYMKYPAFEGIANQKLIEPIVKNTYRNRPIKRNDTPKEIDVNDKPANNQINSSFQSSDKAETLDKSKSHVAKTPAKSRAKGRLSKSNSKNNIDDSTIPGNDEKLLEDDNTPKVEKKNKNIKSENKASFKEKMDIDNNDKNGNVEKDSDRFDNMKEPPTESNHVLKTKIDNEDISTINSEINGVNAVISETISVEPIDISKLKLNENEKDLTEIPTVVNVKKPVKGRRASKKIEQLSRETTPLSQIDDTDAMLSGLTTGPSSRASSVTSTPKRRKRNDSQSSPTSKRKPRVSQSKKKSKQEKEENENLLSDKDQSDKIDDLSHGNFGSNALQVDKALMMSIANVPKPKLPTPPPLIIQPKKMESFGLPDNIISTFTNRVIEKDTEDYDFDENDYEDDNSPLFKSVPAVSKNMVKSVATEIKSTIESLNKIDKGVSNLNRTDSPIIESSTADLTKSTKMLVNKDDASEKMDVETGLENSIETLHNDSILKKHDHLDDIEKVTYKKRKITKGDINSKQEKIIAFNKEKASNSKESLDIKKETGISNKEDNSQKVVSISNSRKRSSSVAKLVKNESENSLVTKKSNNEDKKLKSPREDSNGKDNRSASPSANIEFQRSSNPENVSTLARNEQDSHAPYPYGEYPRHHYPPYEHHPYNREYPYGPEYSHGRQLYSTREEYPISSPELYPSREEAYGRERYSHASGNHDIDDEKDDDDKKPISVQHEDPYRYDSYYRGYYANRGEPYAYGRYPYEYGKYGHPAYNGPSSYYNGPDTYMGDRYPPKSGYIPTEGDEGNEIRNKSYYDNRYYSHMKTKSGNFVSPPPPHPPSHSPSHPPLDHHDTSRRHSGYRGNPNEHEEGPLSKHDNYPNYNDRYYRHYPQHPEMDGRPYLERESRNMPGNHNERDSTTSKEKIEEEVETKHNNGSDSSSNTA